jgi:lipopolysaccharide transport system ATP-binding protein
VSEIAIQADGLGKRYPIGKRERYSTLRDSFAQAIAAPLRWLGNGRQLSNGESTAPSDLASTEFIWALKDVSFEIKHGEVVGIIGRNGAGKSTLLKILSQITEPTEGEARIHGRVGSLLEVGTGFHPELTGRENIFLNGAILGMKRKEIEQKFDEIVAFAEVEKFLDTPVKHYSSGMYARLAFSVAAHLEPDILLVDEVLAVGDVAFQKKCLGKMGNIAKRGRTVLFVSHNMSAIKALCPLSLLLQEGRAISFGSTTKVIEEYLAADFNLQSEAILTEGKLHRGGIDFRIERVAILSIDGSPCSQVPFGYPFQVLLDVDLRRNVSGLHVGLGVAMPDGTRISTTHHSDTLKNTEFRKGKLQLRCIFDQNLYAPGMYYLHVGAHSEDSLISDYVPDALAFEVLPLSISDGKDFQSRNFGLIQHPSRWILEEDWQRQAESNKRGLARAGR